MALQDLLLKVYIYLTNKRYIAYINFFNNRKLIVDKSTTSYYNKVDKSTK